MPYRGSCHCGATRFTLAITPTLATRCTCTFCTKRGALWAYCEPDQFTLETPLANATVYSPTTPENRHYFCARCGCTTFSDNPDYSAFSGQDWAAAEAAFDTAKRRIAINLWALDDFDVAALPVTVVDGRNLW